MTGHRECIDLNDLYQEAIQLHRQGYHEEAIRRYHHIALEVPDVAEVHYNLGLAFLETGRYDTAVQACRRAATLNPVDPDIWYNLGLACKKDHRFAEARTSYIQALELAPDDPDIRYNLGCCLRDAGEIEEARTVFAHLVALAPDHLPALNNLAYLHHLLGDYDEARGAYRRILSIDPAHASARYMHAVLVGAPVATPPREYIRSLFDHYSTTFEENLTRDLEYTLYLDLRVMFDALPDIRRPRDHGLDLGCGTGLVGEAFRSVCRRLAGIDLSARMIEQATAKKIYDTLHVEEIVAFLHRTEERYDLFLAADVLIYTGDLLPLFAATAAQASPDALFCLSVELSAHPGWTLQTTGRYGHHPDYVRQTAAMHGWRELCATGADIRREGDGWIEGYLFIFGRKT